MDKCNGSSMSTVIVLWCLVVIMCFSGQFFYGKIKPAASIKNATEVVQYSLWNEGEEKRYCKFPMTWKFNEDKQKEIKSIKFYGNFEGEEEKIYGSIQVFNQEETVDKLIKKELNDLSRNYNVYELQNEKFQQKDMKITYCTVDVYNIKTYHENYYVSNVYGDMKITFSKSYGGFDEEDKANMNTVIKSIVAK